MTQARKKIDLRDFAGRPAFDAGVITKNDPAFPRISIVMPSLNQGRFIERSILSILNQNYPNTELIVIDGGSGDATLDIIKKYSRYLAFWHSQKDTGQAQALNRGFRRATGRIYGWLNSDDLYLPGAFDEGRPPIRKKPR